MMLRLCANIGTIAQDKCVIPAHALTINMVRLRLGLCHSSEQLCTDNISQVAKNGP